MEEKEKPKEDEKTTFTITFTNRRVSAGIGRTLKTSADKFEFLKFNLGFEGDIADDVNRADAHDQIFREMMGEMVLREAVIKAAHDLDGIGEVARLLKSIVSDSNQRKQPEASRDINISE